MNNMKNYHTHTERCHHAYGSDEAFVKKAISEGYKKLGFADHAPWHYKNDYHPTMRMEWDQFPDYKESVLKLKEKYKDQIEILLGLEAEYFPEMMDEMLDLCIDNGIDYLVFGNHFYKTDEIHIYYGNCSPRYLPHYFEDAKAGLKTGMYSYLAHPELIFRNRYLKWNKNLEKAFSELIDLCIELDLPVEYNVLGYQANQQMGHEEYPKTEFWQMAAKKGVKAIIGMDAHEPTDLDHKLYEKAYQYLTDLGIEVVDEIKRPDFKAIKEKLK